MIENLQDEIYQLENKQAISAKHLVMVLDGMLRPKNAPKLSSKYLDHEIRVKLVSNWEQNMLYNESLQIFCRKKMSMSTGLKVSPLGLKRTNEIY